MGIVYGFDTRIDLTSGVMVVTGIIAGYAAWAAIRIRLKGKQWIHLYARYFEAKYKISARSAVIVALGLSLIFIAFSIISFRTWPATVDSNGPRSASAQSTVPRRRTGNDQRAGSATLDALPELPSGVE